MQIMSNSIRGAGAVILILLLIYTLLLLRSKRLDARHAMSWIAAEISVLFLMAFDPAAQFVIRLIGEDNLLPAVFLLGFVWIVALMLDLLTRLSETLNKLRAVNQELALLREQFERREENV